MQSVVSNIGTAEFSEIFQRDKGEWVRLLWEESTGQVIIISSYGEWAFCWSHRGGRSVREFVAQLDIGYMGGKLLGGDLYQTDDTKTVEVIRQDILNWRREGGLTKDEARDEWDRVSQYESGDMDFGEWCRESNIDDAWECSVRQIVPSWQNFWDRMWVPLVLPILSGSE